MKTKDWPSESNDDFPVVAEDATWRSPLDSTFEHDRISKLIGSNGHDWQVLVDGEWQRGSCLAGCDVETAQEHVR